MLSYAVRRVGLAVVITATALIILISMIQLIPGDPAAVLLGPRATPEMREAFRIEMGLDQPAVVQILRFFGRVLGGDLGTDVITDRPVLLTVLEQLPLPLTLPPHDPSTPLTPPQLWTSLSLRLQTDTRTTLVRILQEVLHDHLGQREDHHAPS